MGNSSWALEVRGKSQCSRMSIDPLKTPVVRSLHSGDLQIRFRPLSKYEEDPEYGDTVEALT